MRLIKKTIEKQKIEVKKVEFSEMPEEEEKKLPEVIVEFMPNSTFGEEFLEFVESVINWSGPEKEKFKEICQQKRK